MTAGFLYFFVHLAVEVICFFFLGRAGVSAAVMAILALFYDAFAFMPQGLIGFVKDRCPRFYPGIWGCALMTAGLVLKFLCPEISVFLPAFLLALGNAAIHISGAEATLRTGGGRMTPSSLFVSGGSFGLISGKLLAETSLSWLWILGLCILLLPAVSIGERLLGAAEESKKASCRIYAGKYHRQELPFHTILLGAVFIVAVRAYMGYGIPTSWNKTVWQSIVLYCFMGIGKALGGILIDRIGIRKTALISIVLSLPFILFGDRRMAVSLIGVMLFSMTMAVTLAVLISALSEFPGLAFGLTTIGLFLGSVPVFFFRIQSNLANGIVAALGALVCFGLAVYILPKEEIK